MAEEDEPMLSYVKGHSGGPEHALWDKPSFAFLDQWAETQPDKEAFVFRPDAQTRTPVTYSTLSLKTRKLAHWFLTECNVKQGDRVAILSLNRLEYLLCDLAMSRLGAVIVRIYASMDSKQDLTRALQRTDSRILLCQTQSLDSVRKFYPIESENLPKLEHLILMDSDDNGEAADFPRLPDLDKVDFGDDDLKKLDERQKSIKITDDCTIYSTSGSTGEPKFVVYSYKAIVNYPRYFLQCGGFANDDRYFIDRPMAHLGGAVLRGLPLGATVVVANPWKTVAGSSGSYFSTIVNEEQITVATSFPYILYDLLQKGEVQAPIKFLLVGGQRANAEILNSVKKLLDKTFINAYGMTELGEVCSTGKGDSMEIVSKCVGLPTPGVEIKIVDDRYQILPVGQVGKVGVRKIHHQWRYLNDATKMREAHDREGYFYPGDLGRMNDDGMLELLGRDDDVISVGTVKLYPCPIEMKFCSLEEVDKAIVFGVPDDRLYEVVGAAVIPKSKSVTSDDVKRSFGQSLHAADMTAGDVILPQHVWIVESFPVTASGKVDKKALKKQCIAQLAQNK